MNAPQAFPQAAQAISAARADFRLLIAAHFIYAGRVGGAEQMLYNLTRGLGRLGTTVSVVCGSARNLDAGFVAELRHHPSLDLIECGGGGPRFLAEQRACLHRKLHADAALFPNYFAPPVTPARLGRVAVVLHDLQYRSYPQYFSAKKLAWLKAAQAFSVRKADRIVAISEFVRQDALRWFGRQFASKFAVVPNPISWERFREGAGRPAPCERPYVLAVAAQYPHKNLETLVRAFTQVAHVNDDAVLVLCGQDYNALHGVAGARVGLRPLVEELGLGDRVRLTGYLDDAALGAWYHHASLFAFPSVFEGFGMPPVEALGLGLPTLTTRRAAIPETTLGLAHYVDDPFDPSEWADRILKILRDPPRYRPEPAEIARLRHHYSPERIACEYITALR